MRRWNIIFYVLILSFLISCGKRYEKQSETSIADTTTSSGIITKPPAASQPSEAMYGKISSGKFYDGRNRHIQRETAGEKQFRGTGDSDNRVREDRLDGEKDENLTRRPLKKSIKLGKNQIGNLINEGVNLETSESSKTTNKKKLDRLTIYRAYYTLLVASVKDSVNYIKELIKKYAGFIDNLSTSDSYRQAYIVLKIPVKHFEQVIAEIAMIGIVEQKNISAADVTEEYYDTMLRIESSKRILYRLQDLLKRANKPKERIKILKEIERVSSQIEIMEERTKYLRSQADYSTITITLKTQIREDVKKYIPSPFNWIRLMEANNYPNYDVRRDFNYTKPEGFFTLEDKYKLRKVPYLLMSPGDEVKIRLGYVDNYPEANQKFWSEALNVDIENRKYQLIKKIDISSSEISFSGGVYRISHDSIYFIAIAVKDNDILIAEGIFKNEKIYKENDIKLDKFLKSVRW